MLKVAWGTELLLRDVIINYIEETRQESISKLWKNNKKPWLYTNKLALSYLDVINTIKENSNLPISAYNVSGEYSMVHAAASNGWLNYEDTFLEVLTSIKRAGADIILTYFAKDFAKLKN